MAFILTHSNEILGILTAIVTAASGIANLTKTDADNKAVGFVSKTVNFLALNFRR